MENKFDLTDKKNWGSGPWQNEPDTETFNYKGYTCYIIRNIKATGCLCGYVQLPINHPLVAKAKRSYMDLDKYIKVHGGITYGQQAIAKETGEENYYIGFDTGHLGVGGDLSPKMSALLKMGKEMHDDDLVPLSLIKNLEFLIGNRIDDFLPIETYKDINFVRNEIKKMVDQIELLPKGKIKRGK
jgi:hypothetical protein